MVRRRSCAVSNHEFAAILRDASLRDAPQDEAVSAKRSNPVAKLVMPGLVPGIHVLTA
jgi:hypothetical protein